MHALLLLPYCPAGALSVVASAVRSIFSLIAGYDNDDCNERYKSRNYRARMVMEPRRVLAEFGVVLPAGCAVRVLDSTADCRYMVLPLPPATVAADIAAGSCSASIEELRALVTRDSLVGVALL